MKEQGRDVGREESSLGQKGLIIGCSGACQYAIPFPGFDPSNLGPCEIGPHEHAPTIVQIDAKGWHRFTPGQGNKSSHSEEISSNPKIFHGMQHNLCWSCCIAKWGFGWDWA